MKEEQFEEVGHHYTLNVWIEPLGWYPIDLLDANTLEEALEEVQRHIEKRRERWNKFRLVRVSKQLVEEYD